MAGKRERTTANLLKKWIKLLGGFIVKIVGEGYNGIPDYLCAFNGELYLIETKRPRGGRLSPIQDECHKQFARRGIQVRVITNTHEIFDFLYELCTK